MPAMSNDKKKPSKIKARLPRGLKDYGPAELAATREMVEKIRKVYELYGFEAVETPAIEYTETLGKFLPDTDRPNEGVFSFQDDDEQWLSLRYDLTAPLARYVAENFETLPKPYRSYRVGWVYRNEKPGPGRYRQFMQFDADTVGAASPVADAEMCMMAADTMEALGIKRGDYVVKVNSRNFSEGSLLKSVTPQQRLQVLRNIDKFERLGPGAVWDLNKSGRIDESGDRMPGVGLSDAANTAVLTISSSTSSSDIKVEGNNVTITIKPEISKILAEKLGTDNRNLGEGVYFSKSEVVISNAEQAEVLTSAKEKLDEIIYLCRTAGYGNDRIRGDHSVVRGLEYYTGAVYEVELLIETRDEKGNPIRFGSVGGGGRYDGLVARFRGEPVPATGFSIGVSRLLAALQTLGKVGAEAEAGPVVVTVFDKDRVADYQRMVKTLRDAGIRAELYLGNPKNLGNQLKYADRRNAPCVVIQGGDEKAKGEVQIKDLIEGAKSAAAIATNKEWREDRSAQFSVKEEKLVEAVREVLARHKSG